MSSFTRSRGANAQVPNWDELLEDEQPKSTGSWLPLGALEDEFAAPPLRQVSPRRQQAPAQEVRPTAHYATRAPARQQVQPVGGQSTSVGQWLRALQGKGVAVLAGGAICLLALYAAVSATVEWAQVKMDDLQYGRPRTSQLDAYVGHNEASGVPSHFVAMNLNRRVTVLELPGGDGAKASAIVGPYLFGQNEDLTPVQASTQDLNADENPDLIVTVKNEQIFYLNDGSTFKLATPEERAAIEKALAAQAGKQSTLPGMSAGQTAPAEGGK